MEPEHKTIRLDTRTLRSGLPAAKLHRAKVWALVRLKGMSAADAYHTAVPSGRAKDAEAQGTAMVEVFEQSAGDNLEDALTAADLGVARLLREIDTALHSETSGERTAALRLLADLHKRPTTTAPTVPQVSIEKGVVVVPGEMSPEDWTKMNASPK